MIIQRSALQCYDRELTDTNSNAIGGAINDARVIVAGAGPLDIGSRRRRLAVGSQTLQLPRPLRPRRTRVAPWGVPFRALTDVDCCGGHPDGALLGDTNEDCKLLASDARFILLYFASQLPSCASNADCASCDDGTPRTCDSAQSTCLTANQLLQLDVNGDGNIYLSDALTLQKVLLGWFRFAYDVNVVAPDGGCSCSTCYFEFTVMLKDEYNAVVTNPDRTAVSFEIGFDAGVDVDVVISPFDECDDRVVKSDTSDNWIVRADHVGEGLWRARGFNTGTALTGAGVAVLVQTSGEPASSRRMASFGSKHYGYLSFDPAGTVDLASVDLGCITTQACTDSPTAFPTQPTKAPTIVGDDITWPPTSSPSTSPSVSPSESPSPFPSASPSTSPSVSPSNSPSASPSLWPTLSPSVSPSKSPTTAGCDDGVRNGVETDVDCGGVFCDPCDISGYGCCVTEDCAGGRICIQATVNCAASGTIDGQCSTMQPSNSPSASPSTSPSASPSAYPSAFPSASPSASPSTSPSASPSAWPTVLPSDSPSRSPTEVSCSNGSMDGDETCADGGGVRLSDR